MSQLCSESLYYRSNEKPRILVLSMRGSHSEAFRSAEYEFEDNICCFDDADILAPQLTSGLFNTIHKRLVNFTGQTLGKGQLFTSGCSTTILDREYDLLFFICQHFWDLTFINSIKGWREKCRHAVLWIDEIWAKEVEDPKTKLCLELVKEFDCIFTTQSSSVDAIAHLLQRPCFSLPYAVDTVKFCPYPQLQKRCIDVYSIGRRSPIVHKALLKKAEGENFLYIYDSLKGLEMKHYQEHRTLYSHVIKRSRYFIANKAKFDTIEQTGGQEELGSRFFEGAAAGAIMVGTPPTCAAYTTYFDWSDAVVEISHDAAHVTEIIDEFDAQPDRLQKIRKDNIVNSLLRHDWVYRWENILEKIGLETTPKILDRKAHLKKLADVVKGCLKSDWL
ncbi:MAG: glycosyltransferase [Scytonema sp. PMC 1069.18]|nr:glycosyltransferase [Scytonema sp. PMC 1069.18]MEC4884317.1 glycosyltransferase [Scytonema sp. PMC 1070.18]